ncbi:MAG: hypothetical protein IJS28_08645 [Synergistaceae bacterium]|nr:hypothetical protein [Synergistaceae bacterium]
MRKFLLAAVIFTCLIKPSYSAEVPRANLDESERYFNNAYIHFMRRDYRDAQVYLDQAIQQNTYLVDYYLMSALNLARSGETDAALSSLRSYLEVRPMDSSAPRIARIFEEQDNVLRSVLGTAPIPVSWRYAETTVQTEWNTGQTRPFSIKGLGKLRALGEVVTVPDQFGDKLFIRQGSRNLVSGTFSWSGILHEVDVPAPVIAIPLGDGTFTIFSSNGDLYELQNLDDDTSRITSPDYVMTLPSLVVSDAELITANLFAVSDPAERCVAFYYNGNNGLMVRRWSPPLGAGDLLFEPIAIESYADWLAVADRANDRIYIVNIVSREYFEIRGVPLPRDLLWSTTGELFVLSENGSIYDFMIDFGTRSYANRNSGPLYENMENIWSFFHSPEGDVSWLEIGASKIYKTIMMPSREEVPGFLSVYNPVTAADVENNESFILDATFMTPYTNYAHRARIIAQTVWNERNMRANVIWQRPQRLDALLLHAPVPRGYVFPLNVRPAQVRTGSDIRTVLPQYWLLHKDTLTNIVIDASVPMTLEDTLMLLKFCVLNGLELDIYARDVPSLGLTRASYFTGGKTLYALGNTLELPVQRTHMQIQIPLPTELSSSGYPGRSMLAVYLDAGLIQSRAWLPLWPDMFTE